MGARRHRILLVDDNDLDAEKAVRALRKLGVTCPLARARDGIEALETLREGIGDAIAPARYVVLLDLNMPRMNGIEFLDELREDGALAATPVFVLTTSDREIDVAAAHRRHVCGYLVKPVTMAEMLETLRALSEFWKICRLPRHAT